VGSAGTKLHRLWELKENPFEDTGGLLDIFMVHVNWSFLEGMEQLTDFQLEISWDGKHELPPGDRYLGRPRLLECLPKNQLERLGLKGLQAVTIWGSFWRCPSEEDPAQGREPTPNVTEGVPLASKVDLLRGFENLKRLSFRHSPNALDDKDLHLSSKK